MLQQATEDLQKEKGVQSQPTDSPTELKAQDRKERDERSNRVHDVEFATEVATSLLSQVRNLQALLAEKEETLKSITDENSKLKLETDGFHEQLRNLEESEQRYKDENWSLETQIHELLAAAKEAADRETRLTQRLVIMQAERDAELRLKSPSTHQHVNEQKYNLGPIQEALDAANHKILELQAANEKLQGRLEISTGNYEMLHQENADLKKRSRILSEAAAKQDIQTEQVAEDLTEARSLLKSIRNENTNLKAEKKLWKEIQDRLSQDNEDLMNERKRLNHLAANPQTLQNEPELTYSEARRHLDQEQLSLSEITGIIFAVTTGDLTQKCVIESAETDTPVMILKRRINDMIDHLRNIFAEVARVAREHGKEGFLGGEVRLSTANGVWKAMIDDGTSISFSSHLQISRCILDAYLSAITVNQMAQTLTAQVRGVASCVEAIVSGDFTQTIQIECAGEILALKNTINNMTWVLHYVVSDVIKFAIEVAEHGLLGGKLDEETRGGDWQKMAEAINSMARGKCYLEY